MLTGEARRFTASYDTTTKVVSAAVCAGMLVLAVAVHSIAVGVLALLVLSLAYAYSPRAYVITRESITVDRLIGNVSLPLTAFHEIRAATADDFRGGIRLWGSGGLFGYYGLFRTAKLGKSTWYVTKRRNAVVVRGPAKSIVLSPDDVNGFLSAVRAPPPSLRLEGREQGAGTSIALGGMRTGMFVGMALALIGVALAIGAVLYAPGAPSCTLTRDALIVHDRFYPVTLEASDVDVGQIRVVDMAADPEWRPVGRTNGFSNQHYHSGWFRAVNGRRIRLYRADGKRLVLFPPKGEGVPVLLEAKDPEAFAQEVRREWSGLR